MKVGTVLYRSAHKNTLLLAAIVVLLLFVDAAVVLAADQDLNSVFIHIARKTIPSVVNIEVTAREEVGNPFLPFDNDPFFRYFFGTPNNPKKFKRDVKGMGTGMVIDSNGHILTNYHVAGGATKIEVILADGKKFQGKLIGGDPKTDLAVIRINVKERLPFVTFGDSDKVEVGQWVMAIGHPRGLDQTVTHGIISAKHRRGITDPSSYQDFIQTDAAINPGNSGGPLLNLNGEVIGVNTVIVSSSGGFEGIGLAIPSNIALNVAKKLVAHGKVERGWLGISAQDLTPELAKTMAIVATKGALVNDVTKASPAEKAGIKKGDVITFINGKQIRDGNMLRNEVSVMSVGQEAKLVIQRGSQTKEVIIRVEDLRTSTSLGPSLMEKLGVQVRAMTPKESAKYGIETGRGMIITKLDSKGPFSRAGLELGDIILEINGQDIANMEALVDLVSSIKAGQRVTLLAMDGKTGASGYIQVAVR